jgi:hypothetical protein
MNTYRIPADEEAGRKAAAQFAFTTPCCNAPFHTDYRFEGRPYMQEQVVDAFECTGTRDDGEHCDNAWFADGSPSMIRATEESADLPGYRPYFFFEESP